MRELDELTLALEAVTRILNDRKIRFHITGGLAASFYGEPRFTQDIDIVVLLKPGAESTALLTSLTPEFILDREDAEQCIKNQKMFQALHLKTMIKIDFHTGERVPGELHRSQNVELLSRTLVPLVSKEDALLSKLLWIREGSHKSIQDVQSILRSSDRKTWDFEYLEKMAERLGVHALLHQYLKFWMRRSKKRAEKTTIDRIMSTLCRQ